eukprot:7703927-Ditylum_brightwellii.AAC.1
MGPGRACQAVRASKQVCPVLYHCGTDWALIRNLGFVEEGELAAFLGTSFILLVTTMLPIVRMAQDEGRTG